MIEEIIKQLKVPGKLIYLSQYGSHLYGLNTENSDLDFRGVFIPNKEDILLKRDPDEYNTELEIQIDTKASPEFEYTSNTVDSIRDPGFIQKKKVDIKLFSIYKFLKLCSKGDTNALDLLFSINSNHIERFIYTEENNKYSIFRQIETSRCKLINTNNMQSACIYVHKQATKYGLKGQRLNKMLEVLNEAKDYIKINPDTDIRDFYYSVLDPKAINDNKHVKIDELDNKGKIEKYLYVGGVQHQFNLDLETFINRLQDKIDKEYTSERTKNAADGNDWKALSHALRILLQVKELLQTGSYSFPLKDAEFLKDIKLGKVSRENVDNFINENLENVLDQVQKDKLGWRYDEEFWNNFLLKVF